MGNGDKTHCSRGHEYSADNTHKVLDEKGRTHRRCRKCYPFHNQLNVSRARTAVMIGYGGKCSWQDCDVCDPDMLTVDHVNNDGAKERKVEKSLCYGFYRRLIREGFPPEYRLLCANHNLKREMERRRQVRRDNGTLLEVLS